MKCYLSIVIFLVMVTGCSKVPLTNRKQMNLIPESELIAMSLTNYNEFLSKNPPVPSTQSDAKLVKQVGGKISASIIRYMQKNGFGERVKGYKWEFNLVNSKEINAWCMPGGKVVVYSGLLPVTQDEAGLAFVMGHEIAHAVARHGNERMSQMLLAETGGIALDLALMNKPAETRNIFMTAYGVGSTVGVLLPYSRLHESEADKLGMIFMAMSGYDPALAPSVWERMMKINTGAKPPEILSTHPSDQTRIADLRKYVPTAQKYFVR